MIFRPELAKLIPHGKKTQTRRVVKPGERHCRYATGRAYAVQQGRGKPGMCMITILDVRQEPLGALTLPDARREGFRTRDDFYTYWQQLHGSVDLEQPVWVITFKRGELTDAPRLLAARIGRGDYTADPHLAARDEPEALTRGQADHYSKIAGARDDKLRRDQLREASTLVRTGVSRLRQHLTDAPDREIDKAVRALEHYATSLDRKLDPAA